MAARCPRAGALAAALGGAEPAEVVKLPNRGGGARAQGADGLRVVGDVKLLARVVEGERLPALPMRDLNVIDAELVEPDSGIFE